MSESYLEPVDMIVFYDTRRVLQLASDSTTGVAATVDDLEDDDTDAWAFTMSAIRTAASLLDSHCQQGKQYTRAQLETVIAEAIATPADEPKQKRAALIRQLVADLTYGIMASRRGHSADALNKLAPRYETALVTLEALADGKQVFDLDDPINAGVPSRVQIGRNAYRPADYNRMFGIWEDSRNRGGYPYLYGRW